MSESQVNIPILQNHDQCKPLLGVMRNEGRHLIVEFAEDAEITDDMMFAILGGIGFEPLEFEMRDGVRIMHKIRIREFSLEPFYLQAIRSLQPYAERSTDTV